VATSFHLNRADLEYAPFDARGGLGKMYQLFGENLDAVIEEANRELTA
jgi:type I restriction enzyme R subunit